MTSDIDTFLNDHCSLEVDARGEPTDKALRVATIALLIDMARSDHSVPPEELNLIVRSMNFAFDLTDVQTGELLEIASFMLNEEPAIDRFVAIVNDKLNVDQKQRVLGLVWKVIMSDGVADKYETTYAASLRGKLNLSLEQAVRARQMAERGDFDPADFELELSLADD